MRMPTFPQSPVTRKAFRLLRHLGLPLTALALSHCSAPVSVRPAKPTPPPGITASPATLDGQLDAAHNAYLRIQRGDTSAIPAYNFAVARFIETLGHSKADPWSTPLAISTPGGLRRLTATSPVEIPGSKYQLLPTDTLDFRGQYAGVKSIVHGVGAPLVFVKDPKMLSQLAHSEFRKTIPLRNLTAVLRFTGNTAALEFADPYQVESIRLAGKTRTLSADYGAPVMLGLSKARIDKLGIARLLRPSRYDDTAHVNFLQPYDPERIPVLLVHGLDSTPATFAPMYFKLLEDPAIRKNYQFWAFSYPSGYPYQYSASLLRRELDTIQHDFPDHKHMVIIGHSMGGMISRLMITDVGDTLWREVFGKAPAETQIHGKSRELLTNALIFEDRDEIDRAIFFSAPHRGSDLADDWIGRFFSRLMKMPGFIADVRNTLISASTADHAGLIVQQAPNSIGTLSPENPFVVAVNKIPIAPRVPHHTVAGDRGKGDAPNSSDGVVPYWSSHLDSAKSEKMVPSGHSSHANPEGIQEARRILRLHLKENP